MGVLEDLERKVDYLTTSVEHLLEAVKLLSAEAEKGRTRHAQAVEEKISDKLGDQRAATGEED